MKVWFRSSLFLGIFAFGLSTQALAWGGLGHRTVAAIAMALLPDKAAAMDELLRALETDNNDIDAASYPDEFIRNHDPKRTFSPWHFADLPDDGSAFTCGGNCLFDALELNRKKIGAGPSTKDKAVALSWVLHLVGDLHQPLHMSGRQRGGNTFAVTYRGGATCKNGLSGSSKVELHSAWDDCLVAELAKGKDAKALASALLGGTKDYHKRPEAAGSVEDWSKESHALSVSAAFDGLAPGADLGDSYIVGKGMALDVVSEQLLRAGIRLAMYLDKNFVP